MAITIFWILIAIALTLFLIQLVNLAVYQYGINRSPELLVACAGSEKPSTPKSLKVTNLRWDKFQKEDGSVLNVKDYKPYITIGQSMLLGGIQNQDIVFVKEIKDRKDQKKPHFPVIMALKREPEALKKAARFNDKAEVKIRRVWEFCDLSDTDETILNMVRETIESQSFESLRRIDEAKFPDEEWMLADFKRRLTRYREEHQGCEQKNHKDHTALISTTLDTMQGRVHFSIHSKSTMIGEVKYAFGINRDVEVA